MSLFFWTPEAPSAQLLPAAMSRALTMDAIVGWAKRRGFVFASSEIYGSIGAGYDYGPLGAQLKANVTRAWWRDFVETRGDCLRLETAQLLNPRVWEASGHVAQFTDPLSVCASCKRRARADKAVQAALAAARSGSGSGSGGGSAQAALPEWLAEVREAATLTLPQLGRALAELRVPCPGCGALGGERGLGEPRSFNMLFQTTVGPLEAGAGGAQAHLRPETAQGAYVQFANVLAASRRRLPFGVGQVGKSFRNEIAVGNFLFRTREFDQAELQYFCRAEAAPAAFAQWVGASRQWLEGAAGLRPASLREHQYAPGELAHYARDTTDLLFHFPFGWEELMGIANRGDFDLRAHSKASGQALVYRDPVTNKVRAGLASAPCANWGSALKPKPARLSTALYPPPRTRTRARALAGAHALCN
jgi:glycyl-tRNA synthetase